MKLKSRPNKKASYRQRIARQRVQSILRLNYW